MEFEEVFEGWRGYEGDFIGIKSEYEGRADGVVGNFATSRSQRVEALILVK